MRFHSVPHTQQQSHYQTTNSRSRHNPSLYSIDNNIFNIPRSSSIINDPFLFNSFTIFVKVHAECLDAMCPIPIFKSVVPTISLSHPMLLKAIASLGSYGLSRAYPNMETLRESERYYKQANNLLYKHLRFGDDEQNKSGQIFRNYEVCILTALLLTLYELSREVTHDIRGHISGVKSLLEEFPYSIDPATKVIKFESRIAESVYWVILHIDLNTSLILRSVPLFNPSDWGPSVGLKTTLTKDTDKKQNLKNKNVLESSNRSTPLNGNAYESSPLNPNQIFGDSDGDLTKKPPHYWYSRALYILYRICALRGLGYDPTLTNSYSISTRIYTQSKQTLINDLHQLMEELPTCMGPLFDFTHPNQNTNADLLYNTTSGRFKMSNSSGKVPQSRPINTSIPVDILAPQVVEALSYSQPQRRPPILNGISDTLPVSNEELNYYKPNANLFATLNSPMTTPSPTKTFPHVFYSDPIYAIVHCFIISGQLVLSSMRSENPCSSLFSGSTDNDKDNYNIPTFEECRNLARRVVGIIMSYPGYVVPCMTSWSFLYVTPYITDEAERDHIISYIATAHGVGWTGGTVVEDIKAQWGRK